MTGTYISAALVCGAALLVGRAVMALAGRERWSWLEPAVGLAALFAVAGLLARAPGHNTTVALATGLLLAGSLAALALPYRSDRLREGILPALLVALATAIPFAIAGRWGLVGVGFNNDLGLHLAWSEWLRAGLGPVPDPGYPLGPHGVVSVLSGPFGIEAGRAFTGVLVAISVLTALTALAPLREPGPGRRALAALLVALPYLAASYYAQSAFKETAQALFVLAFALALPPLRELPQGRRERLRALLPQATLLAGIVFAYSFAGLAWAIGAAAVWALTIPRVRARLAPRRVAAALGARGIAAAAALLGAAVLLLGFVGPFGFAENFGKVQGADTYGPVSPVEALGIWLTGNYRLNAAGGPALPVLGAAVALLALAVALPWWLRRGEVAVPSALAAAAAIYLVTIPVSGDYASAKALMIASPLVALVIVRPLLAGGPELPLPRPARPALAAAFCAGAALSSFLALRDAPVAPPGHGAELQGFLPHVRGERVLYAGQDRFAAYHLRGSDTSVPLVEFPDERVRDRPTKPFDTGSSYSPIDFDSFNAGTLNNFGWVVTTAADFQSSAPRGFRLVDRTPSYLLWERTAETPPTRKTLLEGEAPVAFVNCRLPETAILTDNPGRAMVLAAAPAIGPSGAWEPRAGLGLGEQASQTLRLAPGRWLLSIQYFSPEPLLLRAPGFEQALPAALDGQRPNTISLVNEGQYWPAGEIVSDGGPVRFVVEVDEPNALQRLTDPAARVRLGDLVATRPAPPEVVPLRAACGRWVDWYESPAPLARP